MGDNSGFSRARRSPIRAGSACALLIGLGAPDACLGVEPSEVEDGGADGSWGNPYIVTRDNLAVGGQLEFNDGSVTAEVGKPFLSDGEWTSFVGHFRFEEIREHGWHYVDQYTPVLPGADFQGPGNADFATRAATMVHGNTYGVSLSGLTGAGEIYDLRDAAFVKLSEEVLVVPVIIVLWKRPEPYNPHADLSWLWAARNMIDFHPLHVLSASAPTPYDLPDGTEVIPLPWASINPLLPSEIDSPSDYWLEMMAPDRDETPPDELWARCGIQFQVVGQFLVSHDWEWVNHCHTQQLNFGDVESKVAAELASNPTLRDYLLNDLRPVFLSYGDLSLCENVFVGSVPGKGRFVEINWQRERATTAHELGHTLGLDDNSNSGELMDSGANDDPTITDEQCDVAREKASFFSQRYDDFNWWIGRTYSDELAPPPTPSDSSDSSSDDGDVEIDPSDSGGDGVCCLGDRDVYYVAPEDCAEVVGDEQCHNVCCSDGASSSLFLCEAHGGHAVDCPPPR